MPDVAPTPPTESTSSRHGDDGMSRKAMRRNRVVPFERSEEAAGMAVWAATSMKMRMDKVAEQVRRKQLHTDLPWYVLAPDSGIVICRDVVTTLALVGVLFVIPFEIAFVESPVPPDPTTTIFVFNRVIDGIFWAEMVLNFFVSFPLGQLDEALSEEALSNVARLNEIK